MREPTGRGWLAPEELLEIGYQRAPVVMINEAHNGWLRCVRTREVGLRLLPVADRAGVRMLAMEAGGSPGRPPPRRGYLGQPEMARLVEEARRLGWTVSGYEAQWSRAPLLARLNTVGRRYSAWRETEQARNLAALVSRRGPDQPLLVWAGWSHILKAHGMMGEHFRRLSSIDAFAIDQTLTVVLQGSNPYTDRLLEWARPQLETMGGTAGFLVEDSPIDLVPGCDAVLLSLHNAME